MRAKPFFFVCAGLFLLVAAYTLGASHARAGDYNLPPGVRYVELRRLVGYSLPYRNPWSPNAEFLALNGHDGFYVFDAARPGQEPRKLLDRAAPYFSWSPDGRWIACEVQSYERNVPFSSLLVVPTDGTPPTALASHTREIGQFVCAADGNIYFWGREPPGERHRLEPPPAWRAANPGPFPPRPSLVLVHEMRGRMHPHVIPGDFPGQERSLPGFAHDTSVFPRAEFPDGSRFLVDIQGTKSFSSAVVNFEGLVLVNFGERTGHGGGSRRLQSLVTAAQSATRRSTTGMWC